MAYTLVLSRRPKDPFTYNTGLKADDPKRFQFKVETGRFSTLLLLSGDPVTEVELVDANDPDGSIAVPAGKLKITYTGQLDEMARYTVMERTDHNVVILPGSNSKPYTVVFEMKNSKVIELPRTKGNCLRVRGGHTTAEQGILLHAAPHVGWLSGCISPRKLGDRALNTDSTYDAMEDLFRYIKKDPADFFVLP